MEKADHEACQPIAPEKLEAIQYPGLAAALLRRLAQIMEEHGTAESDSH